MCWGPFQVDWTSIDNLIEIFLLGNTTYTL